MSDQHTKSLDNDWHEEYVIVLHRIETFMRSCDAKMVEIGDFLFEHKKIDMYDRKHRTNVKSTRTNLLVKTRNLNLHMDTFTDTFNTLPGTVEDKKPKGPFLSPEWMRELSITDIIPKFRPLQ